MGPAHPASNQRDRAPARVFKLPSMVTRPTYQRSARRRKAACVALAALVMAAAANLAQAAPAPAAATLIVEGAGEGHGVGMSQDGALGLAQHGQSYQAILAHYYTGTTLAQAPPKKVIRVLIGAKVVKVPLERYVRGVIAAEMPATWPAAALEAQAVASRTYALTSHASSRFDVYSDTRSQVYLGKAAETPATNAAVAATAGQVVTFAGKPVATYFFADSGGMTENIENSFIGAAPQPWLVGVQDPYDSGPTSSWRVTLSFSSAAGRLRGLLKGSFRGIEVLKRGVSPRVVAATIMGSGGRTPISGPELAGLLGLGSTWAYFSVQRGTHLHREPDRSGRPNPAAPAPVTTPPAPPTTKQGGAQAPGGGSHSLAGGAVAG